MPVPSSYNVIENVFVRVPNCAATHASFPNSGTLIHRILNAFTFAKPTASTGNVLRFTAREFGIQDPPTPARSSALRFGMPARSLARSCRLPRT